MRFRSSWSQTITCRSFYPWIRILSSYSSFSWWSASSEDALEFNFAFIVSVIAYASILLFFVISKLWSLCLVRRTLNSWESSSLAFINSFSILSWVAMRLLLLCIVFLKSAILPFNSALSSTNMSLPIMVALSTIFGFGMQWRNTSFAV